MNSRERVIKTLNFEPVDRIAKDLGGTMGTGLHASVLTKLRKALGLKEETVFMYEPMMQLGKVTDDVRQALGTDLLGIDSYTTMLGYPNKDLKPWKLADGTPVLVGRGFEWETSPNGDIFVFPGGNRKARHSAKMPAHGYYFDPIVRQGVISDDTLDARKDFATTYTILSDEECENIRKQADTLYSNTDAALFGNFWGAGFGDFFQIPGSWLEETPGIRDWEEWILSHLTRPDYIKEIIEMHTEVAIESLKLYKQAVGEKIVAIAISGTDFGSQKGMLMSPGLYREMYKPNQKKVIDWVKKNTNWKVFFHSCGGIAEILDDFVEIGIDCLNPIQFTAQGMDLEKISEKYAGKLVFWGGGINTQKTLPFGTPEEIEQEAKMNMALLNKKGGFIASAVHNIQYGVSPENIIAFFNAVG